MKILVTGIDPPDEVRSWSGIPYHLSQALRKDFEICFHGGLRGPMGFYHKYREKFHRRLGLRGSYRIRAEPAVLKEFARGLEDTIRREAPDVILSINCEPIAYLKPGGPQVYLIHDATIRLLREGYPHFQALSTRSQKWSEDAQKRSLARADFALPTSAWAQQSICEDYRYPAHRTRVIPLGANLADPPSLQEVTAAIEDRISSPVLRFLFVGVEWERKGGNTAVSIVDALVQKGIEAELHLVGCTPPPEVLQKNFVVAHGFLSKGRATEAKKLHDLFRTASYFIMPPWRIAARVFWPKPMLSAYPAFPAMWGASRKLSRAS